MTAPTVVTNDVELVEEYAKLLDADAQQWQEIAATATELADTLNSEAAAWTETWEPEGDYSGAVTLMVARLTELATTAESNARDLVKRGEKAVKSAKDQEQIDIANAQAIDGIDILASADYPSIDAAERASK